MWEWERERERERMWEVGEGRWRGEEGGRRVVGIGSESMGENGRETTEGFVILNALNVWCNNVGSLKVPAPSHVRT
jgi:hypothetical protein